MKFYRQDKKNGEIIEVSQKWAEDMSKEIFGNKGFVYNCTKQKPMNSIFSLTWCVK